MRLMLSNEDEMQKVIEAVNKTKLLSIKKNAHAK